MSGPFATGREMEVPITNETAVRFFTEEVSLQPTKRPVRKIFFGDTDRSGAGEGDGVPLGRGWQLMAVRSMGTDTGEVVIGTFREVYAR